MYRLRVIGMKCTTRRNVPAGASSRYGSSGRLCAGRPARPAHTFVVRPAGEGPRAAGSRLSSCAIIDLDGGAGRSPDRPAPLAHYLAFWIAASTSWFALVIMSLMVLRGTGPLLEDTASHMTPKSLTSAPSIAPQDATIG